MPSRRRARPRSPPRSKGGQGAAWAIGALLVLGAGAVYYYGSKGNGMTGPNPTAAPRGPGTNPPPPPPDDGITKCIVRPPGGSYCPQKYGASEMCPGGTYLTIDESDVFAAPTADKCVPCTSGNSCPQGSSSDSPCPNGYLCPTMTTRTACPAGVSCTGNRSAPCPPGYYCPARSGQPLPCPAGTSCPSGSMATAGYICVAGTYCPQGTIQPIPCPAGSYCPSRSASPIKCQAGWYSREKGARDPSVCNKCLPGRYCPAGSTDGTNCPPGSYCEEAAATFTKCPGGTFNGRAGSTDLSYCNPCPGGYFCPEGSPSPNQCPSNSYCDAGSAEPVKCPTGTISQKGSVDVEKCKPKEMGACKPGYEDISDGVLTYTDAPCGASCPGGPLVNEKCKCMCKAVVED